jgi:putative secretion ATPase (PEP-CTERM system associated)
MYANFYGLSALPFQLTPDSCFFFQSSGHAKAMAHLKYGLHQGEGFIVITGDIGAGKTTLVEHLCSTLDPRRYTIAKISTTRISANDTLRLVVAGFGIKAERLNKGDLLKRFEDALVANFQAGRRLLLLVDEAQNLSVSALEELRMLSNFLVGNRAPMQSFLLGQPQFRPTLALPEMEQLRQRILASYHLGPLSSTETQTYIEHRLGVVGWQADPHFTDDAFRLIHDLTLGVPRKINTLCSRLMLFGFLEETHTIDGAMVQRIVDDLQSEIDGTQAAILPHRQRSSVPHPSNEQFSRLDARISHIDARLSTLASAIVAPLAKLTTLSR